MTDIDFEVSQEAIRIATERRNRLNKLKSEIQICINGGVCPKCAEDLEKVIDGGRNMSHRCTSDTCNFVWPQPAEKLRLHVKKNKPETVTYSGPGIGAKSTLDRFVERIVKETNLNLVKRAKS